MNPSAVLPLPMSRPRAIRLLGTGAAIPPEELTSEQIDRRLGLAPGTVFKRTGVRRRFVETRSAAALGAEAAHRALEAAGLSLADVDCLIAASGTPDQAMPSNGALLHRAIGLSGRIPAFDIGASCLSFLVALDTAACLIDAGRYRRILIVSSDVASCGLDWSKLEASGIFGDGAAAAVVGPTGPEEGGSALLTSSFATLSEGAHTCEIPGGGSRHHPSRIEGAYLPLTLFRMDGKAVFRLAAEKLPGFLDQLLATAGLSLAEIPIVVPHQASLHALQYLRRRFGLRREQMIEIFAERGNQVGASLPSALHEAIASGRLRRGDPALLVGTGAGVQLGGMVIRY